MSGFALTSRAERDIAQIWQSIAKNNPSAAARVEVAFFGAFELLADRPFAGHVRQDLTALPLRFWTITRYPNYIVVYQPEADPLMIIAVLHSRRNLSPILRRRV